MAGWLKNWLQGDARRVLWIDYEAYAGRVFANSPPDFYADATRFASTLIQAEGVIPTQVLAVDVLAPLRASRAGDDPLDPGDVVAYLEAPRFVIAVLDALVHRFADRLDIVLKVDAPGDLLGPGADFDALDDTGSAMAGFLRAVSDRPVAGLVLERRAGAPFSDDETDACEPVVGAARHYGWVTALSLPGVLDGAVAAPSLDIDLLALPDTPLGALGEGAPRRAGGLDAAFWSGHAALSGAGNRLLHGVVPRDATPETVLAVLAALQDA